MQPEESLDQTAGSAMSVPRDLGTLNGKIAFAGPFRYLAVIRRLITCHMNFFRCNDFLNYA